MTNYFDALSIADKVLSNEALKTSIIQVAKKVREGTSLYKAMKESGNFPPLMLHMISSGEATGDLESMLERAANNQQMELENRMAAMVGLFEPVILILMGAIVLVIVLAILLPILNMNTLIS